jgi:hypothetical protein
MPPVTGSRSKDRQQAAGSRQQAVDNRQQAAGSRQPAAGTGNQEQQAAGSRQHGGTGSKQQVYYSDKEQAARAACWSRWCVYWRCG